MRVMVIIKTNEDSEAGVMPSEQLLAEMGAKVIKIELPPKGDSRVASVPFATVARTTSSRIPEIWLWARDGITLPSRKAS